MTGELRVEPPKYPFLKYDHLNLVRELVGGASHLLVSEMPTEALIAT